MRVIQEVFYMLFEGKLEKVREGGYLISIPSLEVMTQAGTQKEAFEMLEDYILSFLDYPKGLRISFTKKDQTTFFVNSSDPKKILPFVLQRLRQISGLSLADAMKKLNLNSRNSYARYEQGDCDPTFTKLEELLEINGCDLMLVNKPKRKAAI